MTVPLVVLVVPVPLVVLVVLVLVVVVLGVESAGGVAIDGVGQISNLRLHTSTPFSVSLITAALPGIVFVNTRYIPAGVREVLVIVL